MNRVEKVDEHKDNKDDMDVESSDEFKGIKAIIEEKKRKQKEELQKLGILIFSLKSNNLDPSMNDSNSDETIEVDQRDWDNSCSALQYAVFFGHAEIVDMLAEFGADVHQLFDKEPLQIVALGTKNYKEVVIQTPNYIVLPQDFCSR